MQSITFLALLTGSLSLFSAPNGIFKYLQPTAHAATTFTVGSTGNGSDSNTADGVCDDGAGKCTFFLSIEFQQTGFLVYLTYQAAYGDAIQPRNPGTVPAVTFNPFMTDTQRIKQGVVVNRGNWQEQLEANQQAFALEFVGREQFTSAFPSTLTAEEFVGKLDLNAGCVLSADERARLVSTLGATPADTAKRAAVLRQVAENEQLRQREFNRAFVLMQYFGYLQRTPGTFPDNYSGWRFWLAKLEQFGGDYRSAEMVKAFISSTEYRRRFGQ